MNCRINFPSPQHTKPAQTKPKGLSILIKTMTKFTPKNFKKFQPSDFNPLSISKNVVKTFYIAQKLLFMPTP